MRTEVEKYYDLNDPSKKGPRGFVFAYDENGNLLFHQENMIVETGRQALMKFGFDKDNSKIIKVVVGNSEALTTADMRNTEGVIGSDVYEIEDRIQDDVLTNNEYVLENQVNDFEIILNDINKFKQISIDSNTGNIIDESNIILIHSVYGAESESTIEWKGYDGSCFDICHSENTERLCGLCKIFIRHTDDDIESEGTSLSSDWYSCMGLFMENGELFSRVVFPKYYKTSTNSIMFNYYIYF